MSRASSIGGRGRVTDGLVAGGTIERIIMGETGFKPILHILAIKRKGGETSLTLGDGERYLDAVLSPPAAAIVAKESIKEKSVVTINNFFCTTMDQKMTLIILDIQSGGSSQPLSSSRIFPVEGKEDPQTGVRRPASTSLSVPDGQSTGAPVPSLARSPSRSPGGLRRAPSRSPQQSIHGNGGDDPPEEIPSRLSRGRSFGQGSREQFDSVPIAAKRRLSRDIAVAAAQGLDVESILPDLLAAHKGQGHESLLEFLDSGGASGWHGHGQDVPDEELPRGLSRGTSFGTGSREWNNNPVSSVERRTSRDVAKMTALGQEIQAKPKIGRGVSNNQIAGGRSHHHGTDRQPPSPLSREAEGEPRGMFEYSDGEEDDDGHHADEKKKKKKGLLARLFGKKDKDKDKDKGKAHGNSKHEGAARATSPERIQPGVYKEGWMKRKSRMISSKSRADLNYSDKPTDLKRHTSAGVGPTTLSLAHTHEVEKPSTARKSTSHAIVGRSISNSHLALPRNLPPVQGSSRVAPPPSPKVDDEYDVAPPPE